MLNKADKLAGSICSSSDSKVHELFKKRYDFRNGWEGNWLKQRPTIEDLEPILDDTYWMLSIYKEIKERGSIGLSEDIEEGRIKLLPYVYYSKTKADTDYIKRLIEKEKKVSKIRNSYEIDTVRNADILELPWKEEVQKISDNFFQNPENKNTYNLIFDEDAASEMLENFNRQSFESLERIKDKQLQKLQSINKELYTTVCQCVNEREKQLLDEPYHKDSFAIFTGLLKWLIERMRVGIVSSTYLCDLDKELLGELAGTDASTVKNATIWDLNSLRKRGAETCFKLHLVAYAIDCKENARIPTIDNFNYNDSLIPAHSLNKYFDKHKNLNAESTAHADSDKPKSSTNDDNRGTHMKGKEIIPDDDFWDNAQRLYQENGKKCLSSRDTKFPSEWLKKKLTGKTSDIEFYGHERKDENRENPIKLKPKKVRTLLSENPKKWKFKK